MRTDAGSLLAFVVPGVVVPSVLLVMAFRSPSRRQVLRWGAACDVVITDANEEQIRSRLGRVRRYRSVASFPFWWLASVRAMWADFPSAFATPAVGFGAYLVGALVGELTGDRAQEQGVRRAMLVPRLLADYRTRLMRSLTLALFAGAALLVVLRSVVADPSGRIRDLLTALGACVAVAALAEVAARQIVRRPQRGTHPDVLAADEGLRAAAVSMTTGAALLAGLTASATTAVGAAPSDTGWWTTVLLPWVLLHWSMAYGTLFLIVRQETWGYRRRYRQQAAAAPA